MRPAEQHEKKRPRGGANSGMEGDVEEVIRRGIPVRPMPIQRISEHGHRPVFLVLARIEIPIPRQEVFARSAEIVDAGIAPHDVNVVPYKLIRERREIKE